MKDLRERLQAADPLAGEPPLADEYTQRMRRRVLASLDEPVVLPTFWWARLIAVALAVAIVVTVGVHRSLTSTQDSGADGNDAGQAIATEPPVTTPRQMEFVTAGGTRVIWNFNPDFDIKGTGQ
jgi:hypothetical protein